VFNGTFLTQKGKFVPTVGAGNQLGNKMIMSHRKVYSVGLKLDQATKDGQPDIICIIPYVTQ